MNPEIVKVGQDMIEWHKQLLSTTPHPELSPVDPPGLTPIQMQGCLESMAETGLAQTPEDLKVYELLRPQFESYIAQQEPS